MGAHRHSGPVPVGDAKGQPSRRVLIELGRLTTAGQFAVVAASTIAPWLVLWLIAWLANSPSEMLASTVAAAVSLIAAELALGAGKMFAGPDAVMYAMMAGMLVRMTAALAAGVTLQLNVPALSGGSMIFYLLFFYMVNLAFETVFLIARVAPQSLTLPGQPRQRAT